jgi:GDP-L-fucose synthase
MGIQLMEAARLAGVDKFVTIGTVCAYPRDTPTPFRETSLWDGYPEDTNAPYGLAKKMLLVQGQAYRQEYGFRSIYLLPTNLYGPGDNFDIDHGHVIPVLFRRFRLAQQQGCAFVDLWGDGSPTREFLYVVDAARAIVLATANYDGCEPVNIGSGQEIGIKELAGRIAEMVGFTGEIRWDTSRPNGQPRRCLDTTRAREFGFLADTTLEEGLRATYSWMMANEDGLPALSRA